MPTAFLCCARFMRCSERLRVFPEAIFYLVLAMEHSGMRTLFHILSSKAYGCVEGAPTPR